MSNKLLLGFSLLGLLPAWAGPCDPGVGNLPNTRAALAQHRLSLLVVAAGDATETGADDAGLAARIESAMRAMRPDVTLDFDTLDNSGALVAEILPRLATRLGQRPVQLVVLQAGAAETLRGTPASDFGASLSSTVAVAGNDGADVVLVDPDPDPEMQAQAGFPTIEALLAQAGSRPGIAFYAQADYAAKGGAGCLAHGIASLIMAP